MFQKSEEAEKSPREYPKAHFQRVSHRVSPTVSPKKEFSKKVSLHFFNLQDFDVEIADCTALFSYMNAFVIQPICLIL